jgi:RNA polymerase sigma-70 factor (ECF subfamily)
MRASRADIDAVYRTESRRVLATLIRLLGSFDLAEEALHDAFIAAAAQWPRDGMPANPSAWLVSTGRFKAIDRIRRRARFDAALKGLAETLEEAEEPEMDEISVADDRLRLIFSCCHPALPADAQLALTLRTVCGLTTEEIARAFLAPAPTIAQRIVRAKARIRDLNLAYRVPEPDELPGRLDSVLAVLYLVFSEGYAASAGAELTRPDLSGEAIRLGRLLAQLLPEPEVFGLLALMLLHEARRPARLTPEGEIVLIDEQDRRLWDRTTIAEAQDLVARAWNTGTVGTYTLQAAIAAEHCRAPNAAATDWGRIVALYDLLAKADPSPIIALNRAVAIAMRDGPAVGLALIEPLLADKALAGHHLAYAARADFLRRLGRNAEAAASYRRALHLATLAPERRFLERRLQELGVNSPP